MNLYTCTEFTGHYPVGVSAIVIANKDFIARNRLNKELINRGLNGDATTKSMKFLCRVNSTFDLCQISPKKPVVILTDGNY